MVDRVYSPKSDSWAFGVLIIEIWTQKPPYPDLTAFEAGAKVSQMLLKPSPESWFPQEIKNLVQTCCEFNVTQRIYIQDVVDILKTLL